MKPLLLIFVCTLFSCDDEESSPVINNNLVNRSVITTYRVDSFGKNGDRCGWYFAVAVDDKLFDSIYMCGSYKIGDTLRLDMSVHGKDCYSGHAAWEPGDNSRINPRK
jgi:hypothetical protein